MCAQIEREGKCAHIRLLARWRGGEVARWRFPPFTTTYEARVWVGQIMGASEKRDAFMVQTKVQLKTWRVMLLALMDTICNDQTRASTVARCSELTHVYQFGVFTGRSLKGMARHGSFSPRVKAFWGFDSFSGMPNEFAAADKRESKLAEAFPKGMFDVGELLSKDTKLTPVQAVSAFVNDTRSTLIPGFYDATLTANLAGTRGMRPALYVDIDCDVYSSSITALRWLLKSNIIVPGTVVGYDDWKYGGSGSDSQLMGEPRAHAEVTKEFGLEWRSINVGKSQAAFQLLSRKDTQPTKWPFLG